MSQWKTIKPHNSITVMADDLVKSLQDFEVAGSLREKLMIRYCLEGKLRNVLMELFIIVQFIII